MFCEKDLAVYEEEPESIVEVDEEGISCVAHFPLNKFVYL